MKNLFYKSTFIFISLFLYSSYTNAACIQNPRFNNIQVNIPTATYNIQYDDITTRELGALSVRYLSGSMTTTYSEGNGSCGISYLYGDFINNWVPNNGVATSNIPGIGISVQTASIGGDFNRWFGPSSSGKQPWEISDTVWYIKIKKIGQVTSSNTLRSGPVAQLTQKNQTPISTWYLTTLNMPANAIRINVLSCSLKNNQSTYNIDMQDWYDTQFPNIGSTSAPVDIPITLTCAAGTNIKATVTSSKYEDTATGKLALTGPDSATGVAIQLLNKNNNPIKLNTTNSLQNNVPAGDYMFDWKARYIKTADNITPGTANASATVNIRYE
ncbi:fimbrial protein [Providencia rettgeri]|uniref:Fimbrial protein n=1 Tax=Providencia rettgeri TaxID=587 RepID=A0AAE2ZBQ5_PRORE|nr:fimbrial protein [Providencia rettgeri]MBW3114923.1 fimbrial protein [Providencia rettgeri]NHN50129.1 fimbrial protein [Providencia rettgeri]